eukprot:GFUD01026103.1.p1 GENE.GFUD01026103.1~~GFUD01026103.1.p1  ORF type:complete len:315 (-),score=121.98 GFUD01026103.1:3-926(-)
MGEYVKGAERLPQGWTYDKDEKYAHGILIKSPEGQSFYSRRAVIEYMIKNKADHITTYLVWNTLHREGWHLGGPLIPWGWRFMNHKSGNEKKYLTGEMIVFINSSDALKYIISNDSYDDKDIENFKKWIEDNKFKVKMNLSEAPIKLPPNAIIVDPEVEKKKRELSKKTKEPSKKSPNKAREPKISPEKTKEVKKSPSLADEIKSEFAKKFTPVKKPKGKKQTEVPEKKRKRGKSSGMDLDLEDLLPPGWTFKRNKNDDDFTFTTSARKALVGSDAVIEFMSSSKAFFAQDIENFIQWREMINEIKV